MGEAGGPKYREYKGATAKVITILAVAWTLYHILYIAGVLSRLNIFLDIPQHLALHLGFILVLVFALIPIRKGTPPQKLPWYDAVLIVLGLGWNLYIAINFDALYARSLEGYLLIPESVMIWIFFFIVLEAARRTMGLVITFLAAAFLFYPLVCNHLPGIFAGPIYGWDRVAHSVGLFVTGMYGNILNISATIVFSFMLFAQFLSISGAGQWFIDIAQALLGHVRGGPAKVAVLASSLMGTITGSGVANVASVGVFTIPLMKSMGYKNHIAGAIEAAASNGAQIMPPVMGIAAFIMVDFLGISYDKIVVAAILPAVVYYVAIYFTVDFETAKAGLFGLPRSQLPSLRKTLIRGWLFVVPLTILLVCLLYLRYSPQLSALYATAALIVMSFFKKNNRITLAKFLRALKGTAISMMMIAVITTLAGVIVGSLDLTGLSYRLSFLLIQVAGGNMTLLLIMVAIACLVLGMGMPTAAVYVLVATLAAPALVKMGMSPIVAHFFVFYFGVAALITPPVCPASYVAAGIAGAPPMRTAISATRLGIATFVVPFIFAYHPALLLQGSIASIVQVAITAIVVVIALSAGLGGYLFKHLNYWWRVAFIGGALLLIYPSPPTTIIAVIIIAIPVLYQMVSMKLLARASDGER